MKVNNQSNKFSNITKKHIKKKSRNSKLKEKYYINEKTYLATGKKIILHHSLKINKRGAPNKLRWGEWEGGSKKNRKIKERSFASNYCIFLKILFQFKNLI